jgi:uncharacterized protein (TIGR01777 family)
MTIVVTGGSGFIGTALTKALLDKGHTVIVVDIKAPLFTHEHLFYIQCDLSSQALPYNVLERTDAVVHLAGKPITQKKWNDTVKEEIRASRIESTKRVVESIKETSSKPTVFICASAIGYYGDTGETPVDELAAQGGGFLAETVQLWEAEAKKAEEYGLRVVCVRTAPVLGNGGILAEITKTARFGFLLKLKKENYWMSWIHHDDIIAAYLFALETNTLQGIVNAASPEPVMHNEFMRTLGKVIRRRVLGTLPKRIAKMILGECFDEVTKNQQVLPKRLIDKGFIFTHPHLQEALNNILKHETSR